LGDKAAGRPNGNGPCSGEDRPKFSNAIIVEFSGFGRMQGATADFEHCTLEFAADACRSPTGRRHPNQSGHAGRMTIGFL
jgi:hypothetical protein